jgi:hypothetical protein
MAAEVYSFVEPYRKVRGLHLLPTRIVIRKPGGQ